MALIARHVALPRLHPPSSISPVAAVAGGSTAAFGLLAVDASLHEPGGLDLWGMKTIQRVDGTPEVFRVVNAFEGLTNSTAAVAAWAVTMLALMALRWWLPVALALTLPVGGVVNEVVGRVVGRTRPHLAELARDSGNFEERSFPSGHVQGAVLLYGLLFVVAGRIALRPLRWAVRGGCLLVIGAVGPARVWDGAHWPSDVIGGYALGLAMLAPLVWAHRRWGTTGDGQLASAVLSATRRLRP